MDKATELVYEYRGDLVENVHRGYICVVDDRGAIAHSAGDPEHVAYYRSASKSLQALPVIQRNLDKEYGLTPEESVVMAGSLVADESQVALLESILAKTGLREQDFVMKPAYPARKERFEEMLRKEMPPRKIYHNCFGKHIGLMLLQRACTGSVADYEKPDSPAQREILQTIAEMADVAPESIRIGIDGCGVPVYALPLKNMALSYTRFVAPDLLPNEGLAEAVARYMPLLHAFPSLLRGEGYLCSIMNSDAGIAAKGGARGVYGFGLKKERLGIAFKIADGDEASWALIIASILRQIGFESDALYEKLHALHDGMLYNDNATLIGHMDCVFSL